MLITAFSSKFKTFLKMLAKDVGSLFQLFKKVPKQLCDLWVLITTVNSLLLDLLKVGNNCCFPFQNVGEFKVARNYAVYQDSCGYTVKWIQPFQRHQMKSWKLVKVINKTSVHDIQEVTVCPAICGKVQFTVSSSSFTRCYPQSCFRTEKRPRVKHPV